MPDSPTQYYSFIKYRTGEHNWGAGTSANLDSIDELLYQNETAIADETTARRDSEAVLQGQFEITYFKLVETELNLQIEAVTRINAVADLRADLTAESLTRGNADTDLHHFIQTSVSSEANNRTIADTDLHNQIINLQEQVTSLQEQLISLQAQIAAL